MDRSGAGVVAIKWGMVQEIVIVSFMRVVFDTKEAISGQKSIFCGKLGSQQTETAERVQSIVVKLS
jgi:hypothetical protein